MPSSITITLRTGWLALLLTAAAASGEPAPRDAAEDGAAPAADPQRPPARAPGLLEAQPQGLVFSATAEPPLLCYRAARDGHGEAFDCDLAVQMARDSGSPQALAAALSNRALVLTREGRLEPALADLDAAVSATPDNPAVHGNRGNLLLRMGRPDEALAAHHRAVQLAPQDPQGYYNLAFSYIALGEPQQAERELDTVRALLERRVAVRAADTPAADADRSR